MELWMLLRQNIIRLFCNHMPEVTFHMELQSHSNKHEPSVSGSLFLLVIKNAEYVPTASPFKEMRGSAVIGTATIRYSV